jgi:hypothetical protein
MENDKMIEIHTTRSSMISTIAYDEAEQTLYITFGKGGKYSYKEVPKAIFDDLVNAESEGKYFLANIEGEFECEKD